MHISLQLFRNNQKLKSHSDVQPLTDNLASFIFIVEPVEIKLFDYYIKLDNI